MSSKQGNFVNSTNENHTLEVGSSGPAKENGKAIDNRISHITENQYRIPIWEGDCEYWTYDPTKDEWCHTNDFSDDSPVFIRAK